MTRTSRLLVLVVLLGLSACGQKAAPPDEAHAPVGEVTRVVGDVTVRRAEAPASEARAVVTGLRVTRDLVLTTEDNASVEIRFDNHYTWTMPSRRTQAIAALRVLDLAPAARPERYVDENAPPDLPVTAPAAASADAAPPAPAAAEAPDRAIAPEVPTIVEEAPDEAPAGAPTPRK